MGAGLVASTLDIRNNHFLGNDFQFENGGRAGAIKNAGTLSVDGGYIAFLAPYIENSGEIRADGGSISLVSADKVRLDFTGDRLIRFTIDQGAVDAQIDNGGLIQADNGVVALSAKAKKQLKQSVVNNSGIVRAQGVSREGGRIILLAEGGKLTVDGALDASSSTAQGGRIVATGSNVVIESGAHLTASGATGGGEVLVGGSWQNIDPTVYQATTTVVEKGATLESSATENGGWAAQWLHGPISARKAAIPSFRGHSRRKVVQRAGMVAVLRHPAPIWMSPASTCRRPPPKEKAESGFSTPITSPSMMEERQPEGLLRFQTMSPMRPAPLIGMISKRSWMPVPVSPSRPAQGVAVSAILRLQRILQKQREAMPH